MSEESNVTDKEKLENEAFSRISFRKKRTSERGKEHYERQRQSIGYVVGMSRFNIMQELMDNDPDHVYAFIAYMDGSEARQDLIDDATERDWWPVKRSDHPILERKYCNDVFRAKDVSGDDYIKRGGQLMMKRPRDIHDAEIAYFNSINRKSEEYSKQLRLFDHQYSGQVRPGL
jgi:hypothetical protein